MQYFGIGFLALIFLEIMSVVRATDQIGGSWTLLMMAVSFIGGTFMLHHTGISGFLLAGATARSGQNISFYQILQPIRYTTAAVFLLSPGFTLTAVALFLLISPKGNTPVSSAQSFRSRRTYGSAEDDEGIIEGEYTVTHTSKVDEPQDYIKHKPD